MSNVTAPAAAYRRGEVMAATPGRLVVLLYDGARRFLSQGAIAMRAGEVERAHNALRKAERIINHLDVTLDFEQGQVPQLLHALYQFSLRYLNEARFEQDPNKLEEISGMLGELREAFNDISAEVEGA
jgi:flagellar secretion chaperone FliS